MIKVDAMTGLAVGFAAWAAWYTLKPKTGQATAATGADAVYAAAAAQKAAAAAATAQNTAKVDEIFNAAGLPFTNDWRYYSDGTSISPDGTYYQNGKAIWSPTA